MHRFSDDATPSGKRVKLDIFASFRARGETQCDDENDSDRNGTKSQEEMERLMDQELRRYEDFRGPFVTNNDSDRPGCNQQQCSDIESSIFDPIKWWGAEKYRFPYLSKVAKQILVIQGSSAESERHFSTAGKITRKDRARLHSSTVEAQVVLCEGIKKDLI